MPAVPAVSAPCAHESRCAAYDLRRPARSAVTAGEAGIFARRVPRIMRFR
jgi:hypothetical protein